jgi:hypothetical protein
MIANGISTSEKYAYVKTFKKVILQYVDVALNLQMSAGFLNSKSFKEVSE